MKRGFAAAMMMACLAGCATTSGNKIDPTTISTFQPGVTTIAQVEAALGQPFQSTRMPDGTQQLQYVSKVQSVSGDGVPTTGSVIPKHNSSTVSTMLTFDQGGHFLRSSSNSKTNNNNWPSDLGHMQSGDIPNTGTAH